MVSGETSGTPEAVDGAGKRRRGRPARISRELIACAARGLAPEALTMQAVAEVLGVEHPPRRERFLEELPTRRPLRASGRDDDVTRHRHSGAVVVRREPRVRRHEAHLEVLAEQDADADLASTFAPLAKLLAENEATIAEELLSVQGQPADLGGYYLPDEAKVTAVMRPSTTFNEALATLH